MEEADIQGCPDPYEGKRGIEIIRDRSENKGTAFTTSDRKDLGLRGLLPYRIATQEFQLARAMANIKRKNSDIGRYIYLRSLRHRNERLYYRVVMENIRELLPIIYTPTVGQACKEFNHIFRSAEGFYITPEDQGQIRKMLDNWHAPEVQAVVITDGERILGLGDLGANGMGIPIGKLDLYSAGGGIDPDTCLPVMLDVGTDNENLLGNPFYLGWPHKRLRGRQYLDLVDEFIQAVQDKYPGALIQFEDFATPNALSLLSSYRENHLCFNDDIQGTAAVALAGMYGALRMTGGKLTDGRFLFLGAGSAAGGIARLLLSALVRDGLSEDEALERINFVDQFGLLHAGRNDLSNENKVFASDTTARSFVETIQWHKPTVLVGATGVPGTFSREALETMASQVERPIIFALSNPTERAECTADQAYAWTEGRAVFSSGSPFPQVEYDGRIFNPAQGNNVYIFPGVALGSLAVQARSISDDMFLAAADCLSSLLEEDELNSGAVFPPLANLRYISLKVAEAVAEQAFREERNGIERPSDLRSHIAGMMWSPVY